MTKTSMPCVLSGNSDYTILPAPLSAKTFKNNRPLLDPLLLSPLPSFGHWSFKWLWRHGTSLEFNSSLRALAPVLTIWSLRVTVSSSPCSPTSSHTTTSSIKVPVTSLNPVLVKFLALYRGFKYHASLVFPLMPTHFFIHLFLLFMVYFQRYNVEGKNFKIKPEDHQDRRGTYRIWNEDER